MIKTIVRKRYLFFSGKGRKKRGKERERERGTNRQTERESYLRETRDRVLRILRDIEDVATRDTIHYLRLGSGPLFPAQFTLLSSSLLHHPNSLLLCPCRPG